MSEPVSFGYETVDADEKEHLFERVVALVDEMLDRNDIVHDDVISVLFTATSDIQSHRAAADSRNAIPAYATNISAITSSSGRESTGQISTPCTSPSTIITATNPAQCTKNACP